MINHKSIKTSLFFVLMLVLTSCDSPEFEEAAASEVTVDDFGSEEHKDPLDDFSRAMMELNFFLDDYLLQPAETVYKALIPEFVQTGLGNFLQYAKAPLYMVNDLLQWKLDHFAQNFWIFTVNTFSGVGIINMAGYMEVYAKPNDFGITLHQWGGGSGFDITLPVLGATCFRDVVGSVVGIFLDPVSILANYNDYLLSHYSLTGLGYIHTRSQYLGQLESLRKESYDPYVTIKSIMEQKRAAELKENE